MKYKIEVNSQKFEVEIKDIRDGIAQVNVNGQPFEVLIENYEDIATGSPHLRPVPSGVAAPVIATALSPASPPKPAPASPKASEPVAAPVAAPARPAAPAHTPAPKKVLAAGEIVAPIPGRIMDVKVKVGDPVTKGQTVATMEAMKMENNIGSSIDGIVQEIRVQKDSEVATGQVIMIIG
ncbi:MAG: biotin/lipoyl-containing protein [Desulfobacterales bacterium]